MMHRIKHLLLTLAGLLLLAACATLNRSECGSADWRIIGLEDGSAGRPQSYIGKHRKSCARYNITPDLSAYQAGHSEGLNEYCTETSGYQQGRRGRAYNDVCPGQLETNFLRGYNMGMRIHEAEDEVKRLSNQVRQIEQNIASVEQAIADQQQTLIDAGDSKQLRRELLEALENDKDLLDQLQDELASLQAQLAHANRSLQYALDSQ